MKAPQIVISENCKTKLQELFEAYEKQNAPYWVNTRPYHSVASILWEILQVDAANGRAFARAKAGQTLGFFTYGIGSIIQLSGNQNFRATEAETSITKALETNNDDFAIQSISCSHRGNRVAYAANPFTDSNAEVIAAMLGQTAMLDPFSYRLPPEAGSPALLESAMFQELIKYISLRFEWDNGKTTEKVGMMDWFTQGGGASYLHTNGAPDPEARTEVPEGYVWTRAGQPGSQMQAVGVLTQDVIVPISLVNPSGSAFIAPSAIFTEVMLRLGGIHFTTPSSN